jgi:nucleoside-diphosphate-sugar epimerase
MVTDTYEKINSSYRGKHALVTGGFGFVGGHLVAALNARGARVTVVDIDCTPTRHSLLNQGDLRYAGQVSVVRADVVDEITMSELLAKERYDVIFHLAAYSVIERSAFAPTASVKTNVMGVVNLLDALTKSRDQDPDSIVLLSTDKVYGESGPAATDETAPLSGRGIYEAAKAAGDVLARTFHDVYGLPTSVIRPCNLFGPHDYSGDSRIVPRALAAIHGNLTPRPPELYYESIQHRRDFLFIEDAIRMILAVGSEPNCAGEAFNLPGCANMTTPELLYHLVEAAAEYERKFDPARAEQILDNGIRIALRSKDSRVVVIEQQRIAGEKIGNLLGMTPMIGLEEGVQRTVAAFREFYRGTEG